eukprot:10583700-Alexandrium_andersonii.AAC.1
MLWRRASVVELQAMCSLGGRAAKPYYRGPQLQQVTIDVTTCRVAWGTTLRAHSALGSLLAFASLRP